MPATAKVSRIVRRKTEFRDKITAAALKLFARDGVGNTSIASIIEAADIAHKTFFNHFPTKDHLLQHIVRSHSEHAYHFFREAFNQHKDPKKQLEYCLTSIAKALEPLDARRYKELVTFYFVSNASTEEFRKEQKESFTTLIQQILQDAKDKSILRSGFSVEMLTNIVVGLCVSTLLDWSVEEKSPIVSNMKQIIKFINQSVFIESKP